ncbi:MAG: Gfo/Idh/MocA family protein, partial [Planctomycetota bacterium]
MFGNLQAESTTPLSTLPIFPAAAVFDLRSMARIHTISLPSQQSLRHHPTRSSSHRKGVPMKSPASDATRRGFLKGSAATAAGASLIAGLNPVRAAHVRSDETIRIGLIGCGGRGRGAADQAMNTTGPTKLVAMADAFEDNLSSAVNTLQRQHGEKVDVPKDRQFVGLDAYKNVLASDVDIVILATPPGFRPLHFEAAINAGKHVFMEKPVAVDPAGVRKVIDANELAKKKNLAVAVGLQRHHEPIYIKTIKRLQDGAIGRIVATRAY